MRFALHRAIFSYDTMSQMRELRATTPRTSMFCLNDRSLKKFIQFIDQQPCAPIRHVHRAPCCRDGTMVADGFEQANLAMADRLSGPEIKPQCQPRHQGSLADRTRGRSHPRNEPADLTSIYFN